MQDATAEAMASVTPEAAARYNQWLASTKGLGSVYRCGLCHTCLKPQLKKMCLIRRSMEVRLFYKR